MAFTQTDLDTLKAAIASGIRVVSFKDRRVEYASIAEMLEAVKTIQAELNQAAGIVSSRQVRVYTSKGFRNWCP